MPLPKLKTNPPSSETAPVSSKTVKAILDDLTKARRQNVNIIEFAEALVDKFGGPEALAGEFYNAWLNTPKNEQKRYYILFAVKLIQSVTEMAGANVAALSQMTTEDLTEMAKVIISESGIDFDDSKTEQKADGKSA